MITYLRERGLLGVVNGLWMSLALWAIILWLVGCGGQPQTAVQQPVTPVVTPLPPTMPTSWTVTDLAPLAGFNASQANAVNAAGVVVGYSETPAGVTEATMWANGNTIDLGHGIATAVNDSNHVVGYSIDDTGLIVTAHIWFNGLDTAIGSSSSAGSADGWLPDGINNSGLVVGSPVDFGPAQQWTEATGLSDIAGCPYALDVNNAGIIVGIASNNNATICGMNDFGSMGAVTSINDSGQAVGYSSPDPATSNAMLFTGQNQSSGGPSTVLAKQGLATGINDLGWVIGETFTGGSSGTIAQGLGGNRLSPASHRWPSRIHLAGIKRLSGQSHPFIWSQETGLITLPEPLITAEGINGSRVVGAGLASDGTIHGFILEGK